MLLSSSLKMMTVFFALFMLTHCTTVTEKTYTKNQENVSPYTMPSHAYLALAKNQQGQEKQSLLLMAAGSALDEHQWQQANAILAETSELSASQVDEKEILLAKMELAQEKPRAALNRLAKVKAKEQLPTFFQEQYHETLATTYEAVGNAADSIIERIKLDQLLNDEKAQLRNRRSLWLTLANVPHAEANTLAMEAKDGSVLQGWMSLALLSKNSQFSKESMVRQLEQWQQKYPVHPANQLLPSSLNELEPSLISKPKLIALLLPLSGPFSGPGAAVRDGFMAAYNTSSSGVGTSVRLYDTNAAPIDSLYQQAIRDGANYVVGPLMKSDAAKVAALDHPVPTLLLNDIDTENNKTNSYQFGLSPSNEARHVAVKARKSGLAHALIIAPNNAWGNDVQAAFTRQWQKEGGQVVETLAYDSTTNLDTSVREFLHVSEKVAEGKQIKKGFPGADESVKRRQDFDMIFLLAYPSKARQIMPLLRYYFAGDVPIFATSAVYAGTTNTLRDKDLEGLVFCDMPWVFYAQLPSKNWPEQFNSYSRLYALGTDSYALTTQLNQLLIFPAMGINEKNGVLYLNKAQQIARIPAWGRFKGGVAQRIS